MQEKKFFDNFAAIPLCILQLLCSISLFFPKPLTDGDIHRIDKLEIWPRRGSVQGALTVGLVRQCQTIHGRDRTCIPPRLPPEWVTTLFFIIMGIISLTVTCGLLVASHWRREATKYARWIAFTGMILFCMAALIFPIGFYINEVGGQPYKLPNNTVVGSSYVLFVLSIFFTIVGLLFAGKVCLPG
ncbi:uncharacterized protein C16orf52 homolog isoform X1 [Cyanistes caeruleus]|uniref:uncharacterized protein C16orf52 homolog isoform X1 n=1 Tax=Cyanistes caeruleus TaxID=156563 RepID=UPI000CDA59D0|nr:uncharacterized protein C16orf52 homolog isoform X1 [Cyanistes caeruleus]